MLKKKKKNFPHINNVPYLLPWDTPNWQPGQEGQEAHSAHKALCVRAERIVWPTFIWGSSASGRARKEMAFGWERTAEARVATWGSLEGKLGSASAFEFDTDSWLLHCWAGMRLRMHSLKSRQQRETPRRKMAWKPSSGQEGKYRDAGICPVWSKLPKW